MLLDFPAEALRVGRVLQKDGEVCASHFVVDDFVLMKLKYKIHPVHKTVLSCFRFTVLLEVDRIQLRAGPACIFYKQVTSCVLMKFDFKNQQETSELF